MPGKQKVRKRAVVRKAGTPNRKRIKAGTRRQRPAAKESPNCAIVGIGGSAGGFEAAGELLRHLPAKTGMAFVIVQHLDPHHASALASLLGRVTSMPVLEIRARTIPKPNTVYVQPPNKCVVARNGALTLIRRTDRLNLAIDHFFESLAEDRGSRAIGVVLSGSGSDGTAGVRAIKAAGGLTFAQTEESAKFDSMPRSAIRSGFVDAILTPPDIAREIRRIADHVYIRLPASDGESNESRRAAGEEADDLSRIFLSLRKQMGVDFTTYKQTTLKRRIARRMALHRMGKLAQYARFLQDNKKETEALFNDLLINVTRFFRDPSVFRALQKRFLPALLKNKNRQGELRVWVPGCATGEEVYSLAICILEMADKRRSDMRIQIFGTDLSESTIDHARAGIYSSAIEKDVSPAHLKRFFIKRDSTYQINRRVRDICTFARQNITADPPFSRMDLISCRNVLIYLGPELHKRCIPQFHYALKPGGYLILGPAESVGTFEDLFEMVDKPSRIYVKKAVNTRRPLDLNAYQDALGEAKSELRDGASVTGRLLQAADRIMLSTYAPAAVIVDEEMHVQQFRGRTDLYLEHTPGPATLHLLQLVRPSLVPDLRITIHRALTSGKPSRKERALVNVEGHVREVNIEAVPFKLSGAQKSWLLIIFDETTKGTKPGKLGRELGKTAAQRELAELREQLAASQESLQAIIEEGESANEELKSANEEIESSNEELQSTNEELETAKEELQSTNEELTTLNEELSNRNLEMMQVNSDLNNLLSSIQLPIVMVDNALTVRRATPAARQAFNIMQSDIGRRLSDLRPNIDIPDLEALLREVMETLSTRERRVTDAQGVKYLLRVRPYRTGDNRIDGVIITLVDLDGKNGEKKESNGSKASKREKQAGARA